MTQNSTEAQSSVDPKTFERIIRTSISLPLALMLLLTAIYIGLIFHLLASVRLLDHTNNVISKTHETLHILIDSETGMRGFLLTGREEFLEPYNSSLKSVDKEIKTLEKLVKDEPELLQKLANVRIVYQSWKNYSAEVIALKRGHGNQHLERVTNGEGKQYMDEIRNDVSQFIHFKEAIRNERSQATQSTIRLVISVIFIVSLIAGLFLAFFSRKQLKTLSGLFTGALQKKSEFNLLLQQEDWLRTGLSELKDLSDADTSLQELCSKMINQLAKYTDAQVGAFYVSSETNSTLNRIATYAFSHEALAHSAVVKANEGLVGQAAAENRLIQLKDLPGNYIKINSSLGAALPKTLLIAPASVEGSVNAVIELGFLNEPDPRVLELLVSATPGIALTIRAWQDRTRIQNLLEEAQTFNEELQTQQEELRSSNEELEEQTRSLQDSRLELEKNNDELREAQTLLEEKSDEAQKATQYKSEFLANMSHELRTPLNSSLILSKLLADNPKGNLSPEQIQFANSIYSSGNDLLNLINDILDLSKVEAGMLEIRSINVYLPKVLKGLENTFRAFADQKKVQFEIKMDPGIPETILIDKQRLEQILKNLLSNAFKFTEKGQVTLHVHQLQDGRLSFTVIDTGIGVPKAQQKLIFQAFQQADGTTNRKYGGTGLGLSISRDLAHLLGGSIEVESKPQAGSRFSLIVPINHTESPLIPAKEILKSRIVPVKVAPNSAVASARMVLVIEDDPLFAQLLSGLAQEFHYDCTIAKDAEEGLELALSLLPSAILLDMKLPDHSGLTVLEKLKSNPETRHIPVHVVSGEDNMVEALKMGAIGYILKPAKREELKTAFDKFDAKLSQTIKRVLIVEDDKLQRESMVKLIANPDIQITAVALASEALSELKKNSFDCIVIDLTLPDMSGEQLLKKMTEQDESSFPPVIVYTGRSLSLNEEDQLRKYSRSIIIKGAKSPERLLDEVSLFLHHVESRLSPEHRQILQAVRSREDVFKGKKILVVDDDIRNIFAMTAALEQKGVFVAIARNGKEALTKLEEDPRMDLILMDIMMPEMDGFQATREIRKQLRFAKLPIIAVTAKAGKKDQIQCMEAGTNDYLSKPIDLDQLFSLLRVWMPDSGRV